MSLTFSHQRVEPQQDGQIVFRQGACQVIAKTRKPNQFVTLLYPAEDPETRRIVTASFTPTGADFITQGTVLHVETQEPFRFDILRPSVICHLAHQNLATEEVVVMLAPHSRFSLGNQTEPMYYVFTIDSSQDMTLVYTDDTLVDAVPVITYRDGALIQMSHTEFLTAREVSQSGVNRLEVQKGEWNGATIDWGPIYVVDSGNEYNSLSWVRGRPHEWVLFWADATADKYFGMAYADTLPGIGQTFEISDINDSVGGLNEISAAPLGPQRFVVTYIKNDNEIYARAGRLTYSAILLGDEDLVVTGGNDILEAAVATINSTNAVIAHLTAGTPRIAEVTEVTISGADIIAGDTSALSPPLPDPVYLAVEIIGARVLVSYYVHGVPPNPWGFYWAYADVAEGSKVIGACYAGGGAYLCTTLWYNGHLALFVNDTTTLELLMGVSLGVASLAEVENKTYWAYPLLAPDGSLVIYGRMNDPANLGLAHIIWTADFGLSFALVENGWGDDHCGSMIHDSGGILYAFRNEVAALGGATVQTKLYSGSLEGPFSLISTLPFAAGVNPRGTEYDFAGNILATADQASAEMVVFATPPYSNWADITTNHATDRGIQSIEVIS